MSVAVLLRDGRLQEAISAVTKAVQESPLDLRRRSVLWLLLRVAGEHERAERQLAALPDEEPEAKLTNLLLRSVSSAEQQRSQVLRGDADIPCFGAPPPYLPHHAAGLRALAAGELDAARQAFATAESERPQRPAIVVDSGAPSQVADLRDIDDRLGSFLEIFFQNSYYWIPIERLQFLEMPPVQSLFDRVYRTAQIGIDDQAHHVVIPALYADSARQKDDRMRLGQMTSFQPGLGGLSVAFGQRILCSGETEHSFLSLRSIAAPPQES